MALRHEFVRASGGLRGRCFVQRCGGGSAVFQCSREPCLARTVFCCVARDAHEKALTILLK